MLGYWKWLYKLLKIVMRHEYTFMKTDYAKQIYWLIFDFIIVLGIASIFSSPLTTIIFIVGLALLIGHMIYLFVEVY